MLSQMAESAVRAQVFEGQKQAAPEHRPCRAATSDREDESFGRPWPAVSPPMLDQRRQAFLRNLLGQRRVARSENAVAEQSPGQIPDLVSFLLGCSFTFESALLDAGIPVRHVEQRTNVPMFVTSISTRPAVFWACGVTSQAVAMKSRPPLMITHSPGYMFVTDRRDADYAVF